MKRRHAVALLFFPIVLITFGCATNSSQNTIAQAWIDGWNSPDPAKLVSAFTPDGVYEDVTFGLKKQGSAQLSELHKFFHSAVSGLNVKLVDAHINADYGTIE